MNSVVNRTARALSHALERPLLRVQEVDSRSARVDISAGHARHTLELRWVGRGWPADLEPVLAQIPSPWPQQLVLVAQHFSSGAIEQLTDRDANWVDESGAARIETPSGLLVVRAPQQPVSNGAKAQRFRWAPSSLELGELLLAKQPEDVFRAGELAKRSGWSHAQVTKVLRQFNARGWVEKAGGSRGVGSGWRLLDSATLLDDWTRYLVDKPEPAVLAHRVLRDPMQFARTQLASVLDPRMKWALSGWAGLELAAPYATAVPVLHVAVDGAALGDGRLRDAMRSANLREVDEGARVEFHALSLFSLSLGSTRSELPVVSAPRLYADLRALGGRGEEAADHVRGELLDV